MISELLVKPGMINRNKISMARPILEPLYLFLARTKGSQRSSPI